MERHRLHHRFEHDTMQFTVGAPKRTWLQRPNLYRDCAEQRVVTTLERPWLRGECVFRETGSVVIFAKENIAMQKRRLSRDRSEAGSNDWTMFKHYNVSRPVKPDGIKSSYCL
jgi:hypothetical protein